MIIVGRVVVGGRCALVGALKCSLAGDTMKHNRVGRAELCPLPGRGADCRAAPAASAPALAPARGLRWHLIVCAEQIRSGELERWPLRAAEAEM